QRMGELLQRLQDGAFHRFESLFELREGRLGVVVTFLGLLELAKERLLDIVQEPPQPPALVGPIYVKSLAADRRDTDALQLSSEFDDDGSANDDAREHCAGTTTACTPTPSIRTPPRPSTRPLSPGSWRPRCWPRTSR